MTQIRVNGLAQQEVAETRFSCLTSERLRVIVESAHLNFLIGAGTPSSYFSALGNIEDALEELANSNAPQNIKGLVRASIQAYFFEKVLVPNLQVIEHSDEADSVLQSYVRFLRTLNRILLCRRSTLLPKQVNIFTTNVDMLFEVSMEELGIDYCDGFSGKIRPKFNLGEFGALRFQTSSRYGHRFEVPVFNLIKIHGSAAWCQVKRENGKFDIYFDHGLTLVKTINCLLQEAKQYLIPVTVESYPQSEGPKIRPINMMITEANEYLKNNSKQAESIEDAVLPAVVEKFSTKYDELGIVNPDKRKFATTVLNETYYELIRRLANELEKENSVLFVHGFSFRDEHLRDLVLRAARTNPTLQVIVFCYSEKDLELFKQLLPDVEVKNGNIEIVAPDKSSEDEEERKISLDVLVSDYLAPIMSEETLDLMSESNLTFAPREGDSW
ncbi:MAG: SIR2 family protein [Trueperella sp.]|nr:SIR2 family protein [Trueperella sp.]